MFLDVDECLDASIVCDQVCINSVGTYHCTCEEGYRIGSDGKTCICKSLWRISGVCSKLLPPPFSSRTMETTCSSFTQPVLPFPRRQIFSFCSLCCSFSFVIAAPHPHLQETFWNGLKEFSLSVAPCLGCLVQTLSFLSSTLARFFLLLTSMLNPAIFLCGLSFRRWWARGRRRGIRSCEVCRPSVQEPAKTASLCCSLSASHLPRWRWGQSGKRYSRRTSSIAQIWWVKNLSHCSHLFSLLLEYSCKLFYEQFHYPYLSKQFHYIHQIF